MPARIQLGDITVDVVLKNIQNIHLSVYPPNGRVRIAAPLRSKLDTLRVYAISRLGWIKQQQKRIREQERETPRAYVERESHYLWGRRYLLKREEVDRPPAITLKHRHLILSVRPRSSRAVRETVMSAWYRQQLRAAVPELVARWQSILGVQVNRYFIQHMKTKWGSCNPGKGTIRLNTELAKKPPECLDYIVLHEMVHLLEPTHNERFLSLMDQYMPQWKLRRQQLNRLPVRHERWDY